MGFGKTILLGIYTRFAPRGWKARENFGFDLSKCCHLTLFPGMFVFHGENCIFSEKGHWENVKGQRGNCPVLSGATGHLHPLPRRSGAPEDHSFIFSYLRYDFAHKQYICIG